MSELVALLRQFAARLVKENGGSDSARVREQLRIVNDTAKAILVAECAKKKRLPKQSLRGKTNRLPRASVEPLDAAESSQPRSGQHDLSRSKMQTRLRREEGPLNKPHDSVRG